MVDVLTPAPVRQSQRFESLDVLRGVALLGIFAMNVMTFAMPLAAYMNPAVYPEYAGTNRLVYWALHLGFDLKMMGLFSMLFGAGVVIWSRKATTRAETARLRWLWIRRMFWLLVIGMIHAWLIWEGDILVAYALCGLLVVWWLRRLPVLWLLVVGAVFFAVHLLLLAGQGWFTWMLFSESEAAAEIRSQMMPAEDLAAAKEGMKAMMAPTQAQLAEQFAALRGDWLDVFEHRASMTLYMQAQGIPFWLFWRVTAMMLLGVALTKAGVLTGERSGRFYGLLALAGYAVGLPIVVAGILYNESHGFALAKYAGLGMSFNAIGAVPVMLGHVGLVLWILKRGWLSGLAHGLARVGQMAFTNYLAQSVLASIIFYGWGFGMAGELERLGQQAVVWFVWVVQILWSIAWLQRFRFGPAEWLWRSLTYWEFQPMRREVAAARPALP